MYQAARFAAEAFAAECRTIGLQRSALVGTVVYTRTVMSVRPLPDGSKTNPPTAVIRSPANVRPSAVLPV